jgi:FAD/FMN-containing dehydrogenase
MCMPKYPAHYNGLTCADVQSNWQCASLDILLPGKVQYPGTEAYADSQKLYCTSIQTDIAPACRVAPTSSEDVSKIIVTAVENSCKFAVHSGGHKLSMGESNIDGDGFTIDLAGLDTLELSENEEQVKLGSGLRWGQVFNHLGEKNLTVVGGREPSVGVGGFLLGGIYLPNSLDNADLKLILAFLTGGVSLLSYEHGLGSDNVIEYEIVTASGNLIHANAIEHSDMLFDVHI